SYLAHYGMPQTPDDLDAHRCLQFSFRRSIDGWPFRLGQRVVHRAVESAFLGNSGDVVRLMAVAGGGIAGLSRFHVAGDLQG
ncbi:LysR family transcriptional regulator, partial [Pseudomonas sp. FW305-130]